MYQLPFCLEPFANLVLLHIFLDYQAGIVHHQIPESWSGHSGYPSEHRRPSYVIQIAVPRLPLLNLLVACTNPSSMDFTQAINSTPPAAPKRCPIIDLVELIFTLVSVVAKRFFHCHRLEEIVMVCTGSMCIDVINLLRCDTCIFDAPSPSHTLRRFHPLPGK